ncbi:L-cysteine desulfidase family protein [Anaerococcus degeneri]|uniref:UPF0597 protein LDJ82_05360 n=1 Tax=Anaerococcus degeneri TaxID=361500 RepID=A0ABS7YZA8_9FIRM|nr:L-serine ammonia-lyase, iron-sulfur-dependent, subunit alpha [Anaerococcus degeneri]MBP2016348.1 L-cysteine desulfidase [Anaerococcus degeneri]MCA2096343.1 L-serine ammonia-lyase, iron-sulfur-dependent, subunit alpha [Anaerococcus degeneri]
MDFCELLLEKMVPAYGCTEPVALALAASRAKNLLGENPKKIHAILSGNIIKNANSVKVPGTEGRKGIEISLAVGAFLGDYKKKLEVISDIDKSQLSYMDELLAKGLVEVTLDHEKVGLYIDILMEGETSKSEVIISDHHTNIVYERKNSQVILDKRCEKHKESLSKKLGFDKIYDFAKNGDYSRLIDILDKEIAYNYAIAKEGMENPWGANIGKILLAEANGKPIEKYIAYAAAGSDARMAGCEKPVVINSGSGNQGVTVSVPIISYCMDNNCSRDLLYSGLIFSNLIALYIKEGIGELSAYCGVVSAGAAAIAGLAFVKNEDKEIIKNTIINALATNSGLLCDGAKESCAAKIASSLKVANIAYIQAKTGNTFKSGDGIVSDDIDKMIERVGNIAQKGMRETDRVILNEMINK